MSHESCSPCLSTFLPSFHGKILFFFKHIDLTIPLAVRLSQSIQRKNLQFLNVSKLYTLLASDFFRVRIFSGGFSMGLKRNLVASERLESYGMLKFCRELVQKSQISMIRLFTMFINFIKKIKGKLK